ncbi:MAG: DUF1553 domain-containing protein [Planctomycetaceae bacterium]
MRRLSLVTASLALGLFFILCASSNGADDTAAIRFNRDVRPILSAKCFHCHGPDGAHREADLRLDTEEGIAQAFGKSLDENEGWSRIASDDPELQMPPPKSPKQLTAAEKQTLQQWIEQGAKWEGHWAFVTPERPPVPEIAAGQVVNAIDAFVLDRLHGSPLKVNGEADRERLIRRVTFDLTGLPPTMAEIDAFVNDQSPDAYEKVVDRLLASKHFGERMATNWMDAARYGDTSVFHADGPRDMWPWRDWVINAYNDNMPFDQFTIEQLAGDLIPDATTSQKVATGFLRNNATTDEGGAIAEEFRVEYAVDRVKTFSMVWLGMSLECGQCHDHKYDPFTQQEYYELFAYFNQASDPGMQTRNGNQTPVVDLYDDAKLAEAESLKPKVAELKQQVEARKLECEPEFQNWLTAARTNAADGPQLPAGLAFHAPLDEGQGTEVANVVGEQPGSGKLNGPANWSAEGRSGAAFDCNGQNFVEFANVADFERTDSFSYGCWIKPNGAPTGAPLARMDDGNSYRGFDLHIAGGVVQVHLINTWPSNAVKVRSKDKLVADQWQHVFVTYDGSSKAAGVKIYINGEEKPWDIEQDALSDTIRTTVPFYLGRRNPGSPYKGLIDDVRIYPRVLSGAEVAALAGSDPIAPLLAKPAAEATPDELATLKQHYLTAIDEPHQKLVKEVAGLESRIAELGKPLVNVMVMQDVPNMRATYVLDRGNYASPKKDAELRPSVPAIFPQPAEGTPENRLGLAQWLMQPNHPLTARVAVNRYWAMLFGKGIVKTQEDFGAQGDWPTHPRLLDWMAVDFVESGWDVKRCLKQMVMSATYRRSAAATPESRESDPENALYARGARFRLQAEFVRDNALAVSGLLVPEVGGPGVKPYQPPGLWNEVSLSGNVRFTPDAGEKLYRRSLYTYWKRSAPAPSMTLFDAPTREKCTLRRSRTNTPLQALVTLNDTQFVEAARAMAQRVMEQAPDQPISEKIVTAYRIATGVTPNASAVAQLTEEYAAELAVFQNNPELATQFLSIGDSPRNEKLDASEHAAMTIITSIILNLDETLTRG